MKKVKKSFVYVHLTGKELMRKMNIIKSEMHEIFNQTENKIALSNEDEKRVLSEECVSTYAYGHFKLEKEL